MDPEQKIKTELISSLGDGLRVYFPNPPIHHEALWVSQVFSNLTEAVVNNDIDAINLACAFIFLDRHTPFGKLIKSNLAWALKKVRSQLTEQHRDSIIQTTLRLLALKYAPRELEDYCKLVKGFQFSEYDLLLSQIITRNGKAHHLKGYLLETNN